METVCHDLMIDLETMGTAADAAVVSIGAVFFDLQTETIGARFRKNINLITSVKHGGAMDPSTVMFWMKQGDAVRQPIWMGGEPISEVLIDFVNWCGLHCSRDTLRPWGNGASFDLSIISSALKRSSLPEPWHFWNERCFRTVKAMYPGVPYDTAEKGEMAHDPLVDCEFQIRHLLKIKHAVAAAKKAAA